MKQLVVKFLARCARLYLRRHKSYLIGITGSVGKTTCRTIVTQVMKQLLPDFTIDTSTKNFNSEIGLSLAVLGIQSYTPTVISTLRTLTQALWFGIFGTNHGEVMVLEYGIDHPGDMDQLLSIAVPHIAILTGIDQVHAGYFSDEKGILREKVKLLQSAREIALYNVALDEVPTFLQHRSLDVLSFGLQEVSETDIGFGNYRLVRHDEQISASFMLRQEHETLSNIQTNLLGESQAGYISLGVELAMIVAQRHKVQFTTTPTGEDRHLDIELQPGRETLFLGKWGSILMDSSYNAAPTSMQLMVELITQIRQELFSDRELILCLGEMRELGSYSEQAHRDLAKQIMHADRILLVGEEMKRFTLPALLKAGYRQNCVRYFSHSRALGRALDEYLSESKDLALVLFKGSQNTIFLEEAVKPILRRPEDTSKLCRQSARWMDKKENFFRSI